MNDTFFSSSSSIFGNWNTKSMGSPLLVSAIAKKLQGKVALITGGASGIGECTAKLFAQHGAKVVIADIQDEMGHSVCKELGSSSASYIHCDVTDENQIENAVNSTVTNYGKLDIMFNNAATVDKSKARIQDIEETDFERVLGVNITGVFLGTKHAARVMIPARRGSIISTASIGSVMGGSTPHAYACAKHAVVGLTKNTAVELGQFGIRVNCVSPYGVATPLAMDAMKMNKEVLQNTLCALANLKGVTLEAEDIAQAVLYLGSDDSRYVSGLNLIVDGGYSVGNMSLGMFKHPDDDSSILG